MTVFDLLFLVLMLALVSSLLYTIWLAVRGRFERCVAMLQRLGMALLVYFVVVVLVSVATPQHYRRLDDRQCSDDWCVAVHADQQRAVAEGTRHTVTLRLSSRALRVPQRERFVAVYLRDSGDRHYQPLPNSLAVPFDTLLQPGESVDAVRDFQVPAGATIEGLVVTREGGGVFPGCCIIGDEGSLFHKRTIVRLN